MREFHDLLALFSWNLASLLLTVFGENVDLCSWAGRGAFEEAKGGAESAVRVVQLRCVDGKVTWRYPEGALMVRLQPPLDNGTSWQFCFRLHHKHGKTRIFRIERDSLIPLVSKPNDFYKEKCFVSTKTFNVYLQAKTMANPVKYPNRMAGFHYSMKPFDTTRTLSDDKSPITADEASDRARLCRPCSIDEMIQAFCSAQFIFKGKPVLKRMSEDGYQEFEFLINKLIRKPAEYEEVLWRSKSKLPKMFGKVLLPAQCLVDLKSVERDDFYLVVGEMTLGRAKLRCAVPWGEWRAVQQQPSSVCDLTT